MEVVIVIDRGLKRIVDDVAASKDLVLKMGVVGEAAAETHGESDLTTGEVATINELGTGDGHVPPRPFVKPTFERNNAGLVKELADGLKLMVESGVSVRSALVRAGRYGAEQIRKTVRSNVPPPNAPSTLEGKSRRGESGRQSKRTLIDTFQMLRAVGYEIVRGLGATASVEARGSGEE